MGSSDSSSSNSDNSDDDIDRAVHSQVTISEKENHTTVGTSLQYELAENLEVIEGEETNNIPLTEQDDESNKAPDFLL